MEDFLTEAFISMKSRLKAFRSKGPASSEDALQDAFCRLWGRKYRLHSKAEAEALLYRTTKNITIDEHRKSGRLQTESLEGKVIEYVPPETKEREALFRKVEALMETELSELQRLVIRRHEYGGESLEEIAKDLGMNPAAVRMQISRARKTLREIFRNNER